MDERVAVLESELARLRGEVSSLRRRRRRWAGWRVLLAGLLLLALIAAPLGVLSANFQDLNPGSPHNSNINAIADAGISRGCGSTAFYCPNNLVTREEMASFLARTAGLGGNPPVTNAATLSGWPAHALARTAVAGTGTTQYTVGTIYGPIVSTTIVAPAPGYVVVSGAVHLVAGASSFAPVCATLVDTNLALQSLELCAGIGTIGGSTVESGLSPVVRFPVSGAGARTYQLHVAKVAGLSTGSSFAQNGTLTVVYIPFGAGGVQAASDQATLAEIASESFPLTEAPAGERPYPLP